jgi:hypothetical protein
MYKSTFLCSIISMILQNIQLQAKSFLLLIFVILGQVAVCQNTNVLVFVKDSVSWQPIDEAAIHITEKNGFGGMDTTVMTGKIGMFRLLLAKNKEYIFSLKHAAYPDESMVVSTVDKDSLRFSMYMNPVMIYEYLCPFVHFEFNQFENRSDSAYNEMKSYKLDTAYGFRCCIIGFADANEGIEIAYKRAIFVYDEMVKLGVDSRFIYVKTSKAPLVIDTHFEFRSDNFFKMMDVLTPEYIQKLPPELQKMAHLYNRRVQITHCQ